MKHMKIISESITLDKLKTIAHNLFGDMIKAVVDVDKKLLAIDAELHADLEALLLDNGSKQADLWGVNLYPEMSGDDFIEFDSMINMRPSQGNKSRGVEDKNLQKKIVEIVNLKVKK